MSEMRTGVRRTGQPQPRTPPPLGRNPSSRTRSRAADGGGGTGDAAGRDAAATPAGDWPRPAGAMTSRDAARPPRWLDHAAAAAGRTGDATAAMRARFSA